MGSALIQGPDFHFNFLLSGVDVCGESLHSLALQRPVPSSHHLLAWNPGDLVSPRALTPHQLSPRAKRSAALWDGPQTPGHYTYLNPAHFNLVWTLHLGPISSCWLNFTFTLPWKREQGWMKRCHHAFLTRIYIGGCMKMMSWNNILLLSFLWLLLLLVVAISIFIITLVVTIIAFTVVIAIPLMYCCCFHRSVCRLLRWAFLIARGFSKWGPGTIRGPQGRARGFVEKKKRKSV